MLLHGTTLRCPARGSTAAAIVFFLVRILLLGACSMRYPDVIYIEQDIQDRKVHRDSHGGVGGFFGFKVVLAKQCRRSRQPQSQPDWRGSHPTLKSYHRCICICICMQCGMSCGWVWDLGFHHNDVVHRGWIASLLLLTRGWGLMLPQARLCRRPRILGTLVFRPNNLCHLGNISLSG